MLFPPHLREFIKENDLCWVVDDVVNTLDLSCLYRNVCNEGNTPYHPKMMLKVLFYAYASGIFSSRKIAKALTENVAFIFLAAWQRPNFRTISYFRKNNLESLRELFGQIVHLCQQLNMVKLGHISIDGSKFKANAADRRSYDQKRIDKELDSILDQAEHADREEDALYGPDHSGDEIPEEIRSHKKRLEKLRQIQKELQERGKKKVNATDPDAAFMKTKGGIKTSYNAQACVDEHCQVVIAASVTSHPNDDGQLVPMLDQAIENTNSDITIVTADAGYSTPANLDAIDDYPIDAYIPDDTYQSRKRGKTAGEFDKGNFIYDPARDVFICPEGKTLTYWHTRHDKNGDYHVYRYKMCTQCTHFGRCTKSKAGRSIWRRQIDEKVKAMREKLDTQTGKEIFARRKHIVEPVFGQIKNAMGFNGFLLRGRANVDAEFLIASIAHNLRKITRYCYQRGVGLAALPEPTATG